MKRRTLTPVEYAREILEPALAGRLDAAFPEFSFKLGRDGWYTATSAPAAFDGYGVDAGKLTANAWGFRTYKAGRPPVSWFEYVNGGPYPTGRRYVEVLKEIANRLGLDCRELRDAGDEKEVERHREQEHRTRLFEHFLSVTRDALVGPQGEAAMDYLRKRGFDRADVEAFDFGFFPSIAHVREAMIAAGFAREDVEASGVLRNGRWEGRLTCAWRDPSSRIGTFLGRDMTGKCEDDKKYLYLSREGWARAKEDLVLFALGPALRDVRKGATLEIVEGPLAALVLRKMGICATAIGGSGSELTVTKWRALKRLGVQRVRLILDNDRRDDGSRPGREGLLKAIANLHKARADIAVYVVDPQNLGDVKGPDDFVARLGAEALRRLLDDAVPAAVFLGREELQGVAPTSPEHEKRAAVERLARHVEKGLRGEWSDLDADALLRDAVERTGYAPESLTSVIDAAAERGRREQVERDLDAALKEAAAERASRGDAVGVIDELSRRLSILKAAGESEPPSFSVDRLMVECSEAPEGIRSGFSCLDDDLQLRLYAGELTAACGRTGHCKTTFCFNTVYRRARALADLGSDPRSRPRILFFSCEEPEQRLFQRLIVLAGAELGFRWTPNLVRDCLGGKKHLIDRDFLATAVAVVRTIEPYIYTPYVSGWSVERIAGQAIRMSSHRATDLVIVDYAQRIPGGGSFERRDIEVTTVCRRLKQLAVEIDAPVLAGAQLNRDAAKDGKDIPVGKSYLDPKVQEALFSRRPQLHHVREGGVEQECDQVLGLLNPRADFAEAHATGAPPSVPDVTDLAVALLKARFGVVGRWVRLAYEAAQMRLRDRDEDAGVL